MKYELNITPQAERKINHTFHDHQDKSPPKGMDLLSALDDKLELIQHNPHMYQRRYEEIRTVQLKGFPYTLIYRIVGQEVQIINFTHSASDPENW